jgi:hypothetical protein
LEAVLTDPIRGEKLGDEVPLAKMGDMEMNPPGNE